MPLHHRARSVRGSHPSVALVARQRGDHRAGHLLSQLKAREGTPEESADHLITRSSEHVAKIDRQSLRRASFPDLVGDRTQYRIEIREDVSVPEPQDHVSLCLQISRTSIVIRLLVLVLNAVELNHELRIRGAEVRNVSAQHHLTAKADTLEAAVAQRTPEPFLRVGGISAQGSRAVGHHSSLRNCASVHHDWKSTNAGRLSEESWHSTTGGRGRPPALIRPSRWSRRSRSDHRAGHLLSQTRAREGTIEKKGYAYSSSSERLSSTREWTTSDQDADALERRYRFRKSDATKSLSNLRCFVEDIEDG